MLGIYELYMDSYFQKATCVLSNGHGGAGPLRYPGVSVSGQSSVEQGSEITNGLHNLEAMLRWRGPLAPALSLKMLQAKNTYTHAYYLGMYYTVEYR